MGSGCDGGAADEWLPACQMAQRLLLSVCALYGAESETACALGRKPCMGDMRPFLDGWSGTRHTITHGARVHQPATRHQRQLVRRERQPYSRTWRCEQR